MKNPAVEALYNLNQMLLSHAQGSLEHPKSDPFGHGTQVGEYVGIQRAIAEIQNALSAGDLADAEL